MQHRAIGDPKNLLCSCPKPSPQEPFILLSLVSTTNAQSPRVVVLEPTDIVLDAAGAGLKATDAVVEHTDAGLELTGAVVKPTTQGGHRRWSGAHQSCSGSHRRCSGAHWPKAMDHTIIQKRTCEGRTSYKRPAGHTNSMGHNVEGDLLTFG